VDQDAGSKTEEQLLRKQFILDIETFRRENWEILKSCRGRYESEKVLSESIFEASDVTKNKKELDKLVLQAMRLAIVNKEHDKVETYLDLFHFSQSLQIAVKMCNQLN